MVGKGEVSQVKFSVCREELKSNTEALGVYRACIFLAGFSGGLGRL